VFDDEAIDEVATATALASKRARSLQRADPKSQRRRLYSFLARRGYPPDAVMAAIATVLGDEHG